MLLAVTALLAIAPVQFSLKIDGFERTALVVAPSEIKKPAPVVLAFHGHGGNAKYSVAKFTFPEVWPEVIAVYPQGLPTVTPRDPKGTRNGWEAARTSDNKDFKFVDALLKELKHRYSVNSKQIFVMGHSNGGSFTYALWATRPDQFAAFGPCSAAGTRGISPKPAFISMGETDAIVSPEMQHLAIETVKKENGVSGAGNSLGKYLTRYESADPVVTYIYPGGHNFPTACIKPMADFFKGIAAKNP